MTMNRARVAGEDLFDAPATETRKGKEVSITLHAQLDGFAFEISTVATVDQLPAMVKRLRDVGATPAAAPGTPVASPRKPRVAEFDTDGTPICPEHGTRMSEGRWGWFCKSQGGQWANDKGYCTLTHKD
jgi:hypothetical protein